MSYDPRISQLINEAGFHKITAELGCLVFNRGYVWCSAYARYVRVAESQGMNPTSLAGTGSEVQSAVVDLHVDLPFYENQSKHRDDGTVKGCVNKTTAGGSLHDYFENTTAPRPATAVELPPVSIFNSKAAGYFSPGHGSIRRLVRFMQEEEERYQFVWREDHVGCYMLQSDHTDKYLLINKLAPHVFSIMNERGEILLRIFTRSTSYNDPALVMACESLFGDRGVFSDGRMLPRLLGWTAPLETVQVWRSWSLHCSALHLAAPFSSKAPFTTSLLSSAQSTRRRSQR